MPSTSSATSDARYGFTRQFLESSAIFVRRARSIETDAGAFADEATQCEHRGLICAVIMQCVAALETEAYEVCTHGPGAHLGSNGTDALAREFLAPLSDFVDEQSALARFDLILHLLKKPPLDKGVHPYQDAALVARLRNELVHYKSRWGTDMTGSKLRAALQLLGHVAPPFTSPGMAFFPQRCLSADCGAWALASAIAFLETFYEALGIASPFVNYRAHLVP